MRLAPEEGFPNSENRRTIPLGELDFQGSHLFPDGDVLVNVEYVGTVRMDACGRVRWSLPAGSHHAIEPGPGGAFWIPGVTRAPRRGSPGHPDGFPGLRQAVFQDQLLRVSADGEVLDVINVLDVLYANGLQRYIRKSGFHDEIDVTHINDIEPLGPGLADEYPLFEAGDLAVSVKNLDLVFVLDPASGRVKWHATDPFIKQHDPDFLGDGWIGVFDNNTDGTFRGTLFGGSRIVALKPHSDSVRVLFPTRESERFYTFQRGKWQHLPNGNLLLTESVAGRILEVMPNGQTVWEWIARPYSATRTPYVSQGTRTSLTREDIASWPCAGVAAEGPGASAPS